METASAMIGVYLIPLATIPVILSLRRESSAWLAALVASLAEALLNLYLHHALAGGPAHNLPLEQRGTLTFYTFIYLSGTPISIRFSLDTISTTMSLLVSSIALIVILFSRDYMRGDPGYRRYYSMLMLFMFSMIGISYSGDLLVLFLFWELVGFSSYMLIGHWVGKPRARRAAALALTLTSGMDLFMLAGILAGYSRGYDLSIPNPGLTQGLALLVAVGAITKSAQLPLHVWLLEAMEGPTTVSALLHSATMVAAGAYLLVRLHGTLLATSAVVPLAWLGALTAIYASIAALRENDSKRILAYSTIGNLGVMFAALLAPRPDGSFAHLFIHAWFKASLFLALGAAIHSLGTTDIRGMGGYRRVAPLSYLTALLAALSLVGVPFYGSWYSRELISIGLESRVLEALLGVEALFSGLYIGRWISLVYHGQPRWRGRAGEGSYMRASYMILAPMIIVSPILIHVLTGYPLAFSLSLKPAVESMASIIGFLLAMYLYSRAMSVAWIESLSLPLAYSESFLYKLYLSLLPRAAVRLGRIASSAEKAFIEGQVSTGRAWELLSGIVDTMRSQPLSTIITVGLVSYLILLLISLITR